MTKNIWWQKRTYSIDDSKNRDYLNLNADVWIDLSRQRFIELFNKKNCFLIIIIELLFF